MLTSTSGFLVVGCGGPPPYTDWAKTSSLTFAALTNAPAALDILALAQYRTRVAPNPIITTWRVVVYYTSDVAAELRVLVGGVSTTVSLPTGAAPLARAATTGAWSPSVAGDAVAIQARVLAAGTLCVYSVAVRAACVEFDGIATTVAGASIGAALPQGTITVASTADFDTGAPPGPPGTIRVETTAGMQAVTYTSTSGTTFNGCLGGTGTMTSADASRLAAVTAGGYAPVGL